MAKKISILPVIIRFVQLYNVYLSLNLLIFYFMFSATPCTCLQLHQLNLQGVGGSHHILNQQYQQQYQQPDQYKQQQQHGEQPAGRHQFARGSGFRGGVRGCCGRSQRGGPVHADQGSNPGRSTQRVNVQRTDSQ